MEIDKERSQADKGQRRRDEDVVNGGGGEKCERELENGG